MNIRHLTLGIGMVLLLAGAGNSAEVKTKHVRCSVSATFVLGWKPTSTPTAMAGRPARTRASELQYRSVLLP